MKIDFTKFRSSEKLYSLIEGRFHEGMKIEKMIPLIYMVGQYNKEIYLGGRGEITIFFGKPKSGKSIVLEMITGALLHKDGGIGNIKVAEDAKNILYIDMEQSSNEWRIAMNRVMKYGDIKSIPENFLSLLFTAESVMDRMEYLKEILKAADKIDVVVLDGVADLVESESDSTLSKSSSGDLKALAVEHDCLIIGILHTDKKGNSPRDHIGTKYEKIASTLVRVDKSEGSNMFSLKSYMNRSSGEWEQQNFYLNSDTKMVDFRSMEKSEDFKGANFVIKNKSDIFDEAEEIVDLGMGVSKINNLKNMKDNVTN